MHYSETSTSPSELVTITGDVTRDEGQQTIVVDKGGQVGQVNIMFVGGIAYLRGDDSGLQNFMAMPPSLATKYAGNWISLTPHDRGFKAVSAALTMSSVLDQIILSGPLRFGGSSQKEGQSVRAVKGFQSQPIPGTTKVLRIPVRLYVRSHGRPLPVLYTGTAVIARKKVTLSAVLGKWGEPVSISAPAGAVPAGSLSPSGRQA